MPISRGRAAELFHEHSADALRLAYLLTGDRDVAEDVTQDAFVRAFGRFQDLRRADAFAGYLRKIVVNLSKDHFRKLQRERTRSLRDQASEADDDRNLDSLETRDELLHALQTLPARQRAAVVLRYCEGLTEHETADVLKTSSGAVNSLVARGLAALREQIRSEDGG